MNPKLSVRSVDPEIRLFCNPWANEPEYLQQYFYRYDILEPYLRRMLNGTEDPEIARRYVASGKEIWSYTIYVKQNTPHQFRCLTEPTKLQGRNPEIEDILAKR